ncbi:urea amidolyase [Cryobacterium roopkundense]|uniref:KipI family sensor histidine kinase inhibitor n=1 Tax=Cryobacterium roopkundense TaxID=1001240 RepID=A0A099JND9_9MICO|nr:5-oxoprolinase/urea amidolyase family protein [Cryobacterium roopkundense]KGJ79645.1 urea amidolyase [Cryobacterium roopkundense]MBB5639770.1 KipI family sensor histidine kinase inhibitor [Cryobacterium roopkundense]
MSHQIQEIRLAGDRAVLVQLGSLSDVLRLRHALGQHPLEGQVDVVAAARTVLVTGDSARAARRFPAALRGLELGTEAVAADTLVTLDVMYDGEDLDDVAAATSLSRDAVVAAHTGQVWTAAFGGFAPGFAYLVGANETLTVPRRDTPRKAVPAGSVALADNYSAVYPRQSPGGWQLIGRTDAALWNLDREQPALVQPGNRVQFRAVRELVRAAVVSGEPGAACDGGLLVVDPGVQTTIQDLGRPGHAHLGVTGGGALDRGALRRANRLVGNEADAAVLENALGGLCLEAVTDQVIAVSGAGGELSVAGVACTPGTAPSASADRQVPRDAPFALLAGERLTLDAPAWGVRSYLAVRGGIDTPLVLGSRSMDTLSGIGGSLLSHGDTLAVLEAPPTSVVGNPEPSPVEPAEVTEVRFVPGPRADWFSAESLGQLRSTEWTVTAQSNRIGLRLDGVPLERTRSGELASEGTVAGAIQVPASGLPVLFLADHPVTGGYPVVGVVVASDLDLAAQLHAGARIRFTPVSEVRPVQEQTVES